MKTIRDLLVNALDEISSPYPNSTLRAMKDLEDAIILLDQGYSTSTDVTALLEQYGDIQNVPPRQHIRTEEIDRAWESCYIMREYIDKIQTLLIEDKV